MLAYIILFTSTTLHFLNRYIHSHSNQPGRIVARARLCTYVHAQKNYHYYGPIQQRDFSVSVSVRIFPGVTSVTGVS